MPFTGSHAAAVLPFLRTGLPASALIIGSTAPDLPYFLQLPFTDYFLLAALGKHTHTSWGPLGMDLLLGALAWMLWHGVLSGPALATAPASVRARLAGRVRLGLWHRLTTVRSLPGTAAGLILGAATHVVWDEFTHGGRWGPRHLPILAATWAGRAGHDWAQQLSSLVGALALGVWLVRWWRRTPPEPVTGAAPIVLVWPLVAAPGLAVGAATLLAQDDLFTVATRSGAAVGAAAVLVSLLWHVHVGLARRRPTAGSGRRTPGTGAGSGQGRGVATPRSVNTSRVAVDRFRV